MNKLSLSRVSAALVVFGATTYVVCFFWHDLARSAFTDGAFAAAFPGFSWSFIGFVTGLGWSILYGGYTGVVFVVAYNLCCRVIPSRQTQQEDSC